MATTVSRRDAQTYLPETTDAGRLAEVYDFLAAHEAFSQDRVRDRCFLSGATEGDQVEIPEAIYRVLIQVVDTLKSGLAVSVAPQATKLTTQQAADLLGIARPTLIKILDAGEVPYERVGTHRRLLLSDVLSYRERRRAAQYGALAATDFNLDDESDLDTVLAELRSARKTVGKRRRSGA